MSREPEHPTGPPPAGVGGLPPAWRRRLRLLRPGVLRRESIRVARKLLRRARRIERRVVRLEPAGGARGEALFSFVVDPFCLPPGAEPSLDHTHDWESLQMARTLVELGFAVDAIHWTHPLPPRRTYDLFVDVRLNMERLAPSLPPGCLKVLHIETAHWRFHNAAQRARLEELRRRRGIELPPHRLLEENRAIEVADCATILGNELTASTYAFAGKPLHRVPISNPILYPSPAGKDFAACRRRFLWLGSDGFVHKGLDLVLEAFAGLPGYELTVCGPFFREPRFEIAFWSELHHTPNIRTLGWVDVASEQFRRLATATLAMVYPSCSEGGGGSLITAMHAGLIPLATREASVDLEPGFGVLLEDPTVEGIQAAVRRLADLPAERLEAMAVAAWRHVRTQHTRERFAAGYRRAMREILAGAGFRGGVGE
ncbi:MAG TPA: glycosyltransferase [Thermoanaerobaculia bacterium]|nr:glycosyltransferase [Thermoanaerobaculia bacterium]